MTKEEEIAAINERLVVAGQWVQDLQRERALRLNLPFPVLRNDGEIVWVSAKEFYGE